MDKKKLGKQVKALEIAMEPMKPMMHISGDDLSDVKKWQVGKQYDLEVVVKMVGKHDRNGQVDGDFEIVEYLSSGPYDAKKEAAEPKE